ncbi:DNA cytosine methyltransferase [Nitratidesulfovibrio vulgaris]|uniref:DNA (cytosine-5-)-methyltransferase n=1 Tax=Nitratidesulfovibrio vulgaris (strain DP4) TaxID=391774 RepID=A0A0H3A7C4_NITV4|nr:DNA cytosine methyltransferase [Nitratidesulfovibrio vulgaris]ABM28060.1 C-5 cytosine-specific DNA methylase [Nitratidesulfovibrio vulgaris DP4]
MLLDLLNISRDEIVVDLFAGGGGASLGIEMAGCRVHAAVNHDPVAVSLHRENHPDTEHYTQDVFTVSPQWVTRGRKVGLLWASPDCTHHSKAKGGAPTRNARRRELARVIVDKWIPELRPSGAHPRVIILENVEEFQDWGPLDAKGRIIEAQRGKSFKRFISDLKRFGYKVEWRELRACDYGTPTIRKRLFLIARRDKLPIVWPEPTHGAPGSPKVLAGQRRPWRTAAECIDWSLPCPSVFASSGEIMERHGVRAIRPLSPNTLRRVAKGIQRYVVEAAEPFVVQMRTGAVGHPIDEPLRTVTAGGKAARPGTGNTFALCVPSIQTYYGDHAGTHDGARRGCAMDAPVGSVTAGGNRHALAVAHLQRQFGNSVGQECDKPAPTVMPGGDGKTAVCAAMLKHYGGVVGHEVEQPLGTVTRVDHHSLMTAVVVGAGGPSYGGRPAAVDAPLGTVLTDNHRAVAVCKMRGDNVGHGADEPLHTVSARGTHHALLAATIAKDYGTGGCVDTRAPLATVTQRDKLELVTGCLAAYYGAEGDGQPVTAPMRTTTTRDRFAFVRALLDEYTPGVEPVVTIGGQRYAVVDIGLRMLTPRELARAQGFPDTYMLDMVGGQPVTKAAQVSMIGNSVCPDLAAALVGANYKPVRHDAPVVAMPLLEVCNA